MKVMTRNCERIASVDFFYLLQIHCKWHCDNPRQITAAVDDIFEMSRHVCLCISDYWWRRRVLKVCRTSSEEISTTSSLWLCSEGRGATSKQRLGLEIGNAFKADPKKLFSLSFLLAERNNQNVSDRCGDCRMEEVQQPFSVYESQYRLNHEGGRITNPAVQFTSLCQQSCLSLRNMYRDCLEWLDTPCQRKHPQSRCCWWQVIAPHCISDKQLLLFSHAASIRNRSVWGTVWRSS